MADTSTERRPKRKHVRGSRDASDSTGTTLPVCHSLQQVNQKPTSKQDRDALRHEVEALEAELDALRARTGLPTRTDRAAIDTVRRQIKDVEVQLHTNDTYIGRLDSLVMNRLLLPAVNPLSTFIHLPQDMEQRRAILRGMQELKLRRGIEVATEWLYHLDPTVPYRSEQGVTIETGEYVCSRFEIDQFPNFQTARQLYHTLVHFLYHMEISVTEGLGQLTLREDSDDTFDPTIWNHRFVTIIEEIGVPEELNFVCFAQFYKHSPSTNSPMGIAVIDTVNIDDLYPYVPEERTCKEIQTVQMIYEVPKPGSTTGEIMVVLKQCRYCVQLPPQFEAAPHVMELLTRNVGRWSNYTIKYLRDYVVPETTP